MNFGARGRFNLANDLLRHLRRSLTHVNLRFSDEVHRAQFERAQGRVGASLG